MFYVFTYRAVLLGHYRILRRVLELRPDLMQHPIDHVGRTPVQHVLLQRNIGVLPMSPGETTLDYTAMPEYHVHFRTTRLAPLPPNFAYTLRLLLDMPLSAVNGDLRSEPNVKLMVISLADAIDEGRFTDHLEMALTYVMHPRVQLSIASLEGVVFVLLRSDEHRFLGPFVSLCGTRRNAIPWYHVFPSCLESLSTLAISMGAYSCLMWLSHAVGFDVTSSYTGKAPRVMRPARYSVYTNNLVRSDINLFARLFESTHMYPTRALVGLLRFMLDLPSANPDKHVDGATIIHLAMDARCPPLLVELLRRPGRLDSRTVVCDCLDMCTPLEYGIERNFLYETEILMSDPRVNVVAVDQRRNYFVSAALAGHVEFVRLFLAAGLPAYTIYDDRVNNGSCLMDFNVTGFCYTFGWYAQGGQDSLSCVLVEPLAKRLTIARLLHSAGGNYSKGFVIYSHLTAMQRRCVDLLMSVGNAPLSLAEIARNAMMAALKARHGRTGRSLLALYANSPRRFASLLPPSVIDMFKFGGDGGPGAHYNSSLNDVRDHFCS